MIRAVLYLFLAVIIITLLRYVIGAVTKVFADFLLPKSASDASKDASNGGNVDELKRDPVCGTFIPVSTSVKKTVNGEVIYFCSEACRDKYKG